MAGQAGTHTGDSSAAPSAPARVFTIAPSAPFLTTLADALVDGRLAGPLAAGDGGRPDPLALSAATIYVPTRRAARDLGRAILERLGGRAAILPAIRPLGDVEEDLLALDGPAGRHAPDLAPAADALGRRLAMSELVLGWARALSDDSRALIRGETIAVPTSPADAVRLADDLLRLMDQMTTEEISWDGLATLVPEEHAGYWQITLAFLSVATRWWPEILAEQGLTDPVARRIALLRAETERMRRNPPQGPVIVAGSTGAIPITAELMAAIARLPQGAIVLPGLDRDLEAGDWEMLTQGEGAPSHPQFGFARLLARIGIGRDDVQVIAAGATAAGRPAGQAAARARLVSEAFRPAGATDAWAGVEARLGGPQAIGEALAGLDLIEARNDREEALAIAIAMRAAVEEGHSVALIAPDRAIARRVQGELLRWSILADDSAGQPLGQTPAGILARLVADVGVACDDPHALLALLKHPFAGFGLPPGAAQAAARQLELHVLRGPRLETGFAALIAATANAGDEAALDLARRAAAALAPLADLAAGGGLHRMTALAAATLDALGQVVAVAGEDGSPPATPATVAGDRSFRAMSAAIERIAAAATSGLELKAPEWPALMATLTGDAAVRTAGTGDPRVRIWGALEARLVSTDVVILSGLNEAVWPAIPKSDPWLTRSMRTRLGLEPPERYIGLSAHDVTQALIAPRVIVTRAERIGSTPTVASRWLLRLKAVAGEAAWAGAAGRGSHFLALARSLDRPAGPPLPALPPNPKPPVAVRPRDFSVTEIETLVRDPYAIYARRILKLTPLDPLAADPGGPERGMMVHRALARFFAGNPADLGPDGLAGLIACGEEAFAAMAAYPEVLALWWPRFCRAAEALLQEEAARPRPASIAVEVAGRHLFFVNGRPCTLRGRADRLDTGADGRLTVIDYKTGNPPAKGDVLAFRAPQLPLEAAMARAGAFEGIPAGLPLAELRYVAVRGTNPPVRTEAVVPKEEHALEALAERTFAFLTELLEGYDDPRRGYDARMLMFAARSFAGAYDHLARLGEWGSAGEDS